MKIKRIMSALLAVVLLCALAGCGGKGDSTDAADSRDVTDGEVVEGVDGDKILVAYFSATGHTKAAAEALADGLGADLYEIVPAEPYTDADLDYTDPKSRSNTEMNDPGARPEISGSVEDMEQYGTVFLGYPIWFGEAPRIMDTFVESYDLYGKTLVPFCTSSSSGFGSSDSYLRAAAGGSVWLDGHRFSADDTDEDIMSWVGGLELERTGG